MRKAEVFTFGCRLNTLESEVINKHIKDAKLHDVLVVNTCAVTQEAERQAKQAIRRLRRNNPNSRIIVTGCSAQLYPEKFASMTEVDRVIGNEEKLIKSSYIGDDHEPVSVNDIMSVRETAGHLLKGFENRTRAFVQIQQGCDHRCTFCIIPFARGPNRSVHIDKLVTHVQYLVNSGYQEVVLTGVDICSYGSDLSGTPRLGDLVLKILHKVPNLMRLRLSTLDPAAIDKAVFKALAEEPRLMPHLHLSLQAADDMILKRMKRRHSREEAINVCKQARRARPDVVLGADIISGFPTETELMFKNTLSGITDMGLTYLHVFPYSKRPGTPASKMPLVPKAIRKDRAKRLRLEGEKFKRAYFKSRIGTIVDVLVEKEGTFGPQGHCNYFTPVYGIKGARPGTINKVEIIESNHDHLVGQLV